MAWTCFDIGHCAIKVKVTVGILKFSAFIRIQNVRSCNLVYPVTLLPKYIAINI